MTTWTKLKLGNKTFSSVVRILDEMKEVVFDKQFLATANMDLELYYMFRDVSKHDTDAAKIKAHGLRYDITIIPPNTLGSEFVKTAGHYHPLLPDSNLTYPEMYEVLEGEAHYLLQRRAEGTGTERITDVILVKAKEGDKVVIPPNYGHVTINPSETVLTMANWVASEFASIYEPIKRRCGAAYYELTNGEFIKNVNYETVPDIRALKPSDTWLNGIELNKEEAMYALIREPAKLAFLTNPTSVFT